MMELERRALLGDRQAQEECTRQGIVLPCGCGNPAKLSYVERDPSADFDPCHGYVVTCTGCNMNSWYHKEKQEAIAVWNNRAAPPIGRCKDCKYEKKATFNKEGFLVCPCSGMEITPFYFCNHFKAKE
ncbi:hypothetical protein H6B15_03065 [Gemmiger formicilis]|uniref:hypothetical protein n=1 Tax=Gemmiger formicilis TaxID=745368 RepID=UPI00195EA5DA|nr:hypothetical protein [Gemmiger formicilis]MBM6715642.1 hypothetical protein [Gemmiger formicilis]